MAITINGLPVGSGTPGPNSVGTVEIIDDSVESIDIKDGTITVADLAFDPFISGPRTYTILVASGTVDPSLHELVLLDTTVSTVTASLPAAPSDGEWVEIKWFTGSLSAVVSGNGKLVDGAASVPLGPGSARKFTFISSLDEWMIT